MIRDDEPVVGVEATCPVAPAAKVTGDAERAATEAIPGTVTVSVIIAARNASGTITRLLDSIARCGGSVEEVIVVDDASSDGTDSLAAARGARVVRFSSHRGVSAARNAGVAVSSGSALAFLDADDEVAPGWANALRGRFAEGAQLCAATLLPPARRSISEWSGALAARTGSALQRGGAFLPAVTGAGLAVDRSAFLSVGGFDERLHAGEDTDLSYRLALAGVSVVQADDAVVVFHPRSTIRGRIRQEIRNESWAQRRYWRYYHFAFANGRRIARPVDIVPQIAMLVGWVLLGRPGGRETAAEAAMRPVLTVADLIGIIVGWCGLRFGRFPGVPPIAPPSSAARDATRAISDTPALVVGCGPVAAAVIRAALRLDHNLLVADRSLIRWAAARWEDPPPLSWSLARRTGWRQTADLARRIERERPTKAGHAVSIAHGAHASRHGGRVWVVVCDRVTARRLTREWPHIPTLTIGAGRAGASTIRLRSAGKSIELALGTPLAPSARWILGSQARQDWR